MQENVQCEQPWLLDVLEGNEDLQDSAGTTEVITIWGHLKGKSEGDDRPHMGHPSWWSRVKSGPGVGKGQGSARD